MDFVNRSLGGGCGLAKLGKLDHSTVPDGKTPNLYNQGHIRKYIFCTLLLMQEKVYDA